mmetsp:Transcript_56697/g.61423  ORF Transcript_56697/g.61423 Transcript_56697/m.61423 type:complete len:220 (+) Transcript_56697:2907-3566(+)
MFFHLGANVGFNIFREFGTLQIFSHWSLRSRFQPSRLLTFLDCTPGTSKLRSLVFVLTSIEKSTDLMDPSLTTIALDPTFFVCFIVLFLRELLFPNRNLGKFEQLTLLEFLKTLMAPMVLIVAPHKIITIPSNALRGTIEAVAVKYGRFKQEFFTSTQRTSLPISALCILFGIQLLHKVFEILYKLGLHFIRHVINNRPFGIVQHCIVKCCMNMVMKVI